MSRRLGRLTAFLRLDGTQFNRDVDRQRSRLRGLASFARRVIAPLAAAAAALGSVVAIRNTLDLVDAQAKLARSLGTTSESLQVLSRAAELAGIDQGQLEASSRDLFRRLSQAAASGGPAADMLERLGLTAQGLLDLPLDERILAINSALEEHIPAAERAAVAGALFGEEGSLVMTRLDPATLRQATEEIEQFGRVVSDVEAGQIEQANDALSLMMLSLRAFTTDATIALAPFLDRLSRLIAQVLRSLRPIVTGFRDWVLVIRSMGEYIYSASAGLRQNREFWLGIWRAVGRVFSAIASFGTGLAAVIQQTGSFGAVWEHIKAIAVEVAQRIGGAFRAMGLRAAAAFLTLDARVTTTLGEILQRAGEWAGRMADIAIGAKDAMLAGFAALPQALGSLMYQAADAAIGGVEGLINGVVTRVNRFIERINGTISQLPDWARRGFNGIGSLAEVSLGGVANPYADRPGVAQSARDAFAAAQGQSNFGTFGANLQAHGAGLGRNADASRQAAEALEEANSGALSSVEALSEAMEEARAAAEAANEATGELNDDLGEVPDAAGGAADALAGGGGGGASVAEAAEEAADSMDTLRDRLGGIARGLASAIGQGQRFGDILTNAILRVGEAWLANGIEGILLNVSQLSNGGRGNWFARVLSAVLPGRAQGGGVRAGQIYQVNENTAQSEWMFTSGNGGVLNHGQMNSAVNSALRGGASASGGGLSVTVGIDDQGGLKAFVYDSFGKLLAASKPAIVQEAAAAGRSATIQTLQQTRRGVNL